MLSKILLSLSSMAWNETSEGILRSDNGEQMLLVTKFESLLLSNAYDEKLLSDILISGKIYVKLYLASHRNFPN